MNSSFRFKQFEIEHNRCAQKVGTDGVLLGAWAPVENATQVLDVGTGSALIALMIAQRSQAQITGIDIDHDSVLQARENVARSPWSQRITIVQGDFTNISLPTLFAKQATPWKQDFSPALNILPHGSGTSVPQTSNPIDFSLAIVSNPPFFDNSLECPDKRRSMARHTSALPLPILAQRSSQLLDDGGTLTVILPYELAERFTFLCQSAKLYLSRRCDIRPTESKPPHRSLLHYTKGLTTAYQHQQLTLLTHDGHRTPEHQQLTCDYYIK